MSVREIISTHRAGQWKAADHQHVHSAQGATRDSRLCTANMNKLAHHMQVGGRNRDEIIEQLTAVADPSDHVGARYRQRWTRN